MLLSLGWWEGCSLLPNSFPKPNICKQKDLDHLVVPYQSSSIQTCTTWSNMSESCSHNLELMHQKMQAFCTVEVNKKMPVLQLDNPRPNIPETNQQKSVTINHQGLAHLFLFTKSVPYQLQLFLGLRCIYVQIGVHQCRPGHKMPFGSLIPVISDFLMME